jgi:hypothetical protein
LATFCSRLREYSTTWSISGKRKFSVRLSSPLHIATSFIMQDKLNGQHAITALVTIQME